MEGGTQSLTFFGKCANFKAFSGTGGWAEDDLKAKGAITMETSITPGQRKQFSRFVEDAATKALDEAGLDKDGVQRIISRGGDLQACILQAIRELSVDFVANTWNFWAKAWAEILGRPVEVPPMPTISAKAMEAFECFSLRVVYLPAITEKDYPPDFVKPAWGKYIAASQIERKPLVGRWVAIETIEKPDWDDPKGYGNGNDPLARKLGLQSRFNMSWDDLTPLLPTAGKLLGTKETRRPTAEEWNLVGNLFLWLNQHKDEHLPDLGSTRSWEWCENACGSEFRLFIGVAGFGGLAVVDRFWRGDRRGSFGFRVLAVL